MALAHSQGISTESPISSVIKGIKVPLIAEGIENREISDRLISPGCDHSQGYHFARPNLSPDAALVIFG
ncbi:EAL domain-containing protein [Enterobacteriaceae bacterium RIT691]|nr:EAL domain-containing protein [Enterobacteriaceae bacterium RIT691]